METLKAWAKNWKRQLFILYFAYRDDRVSWHAKAFAACVVAYAFSPIDLIPDFIPVIGYLDDLVIVPLGIMLAFRMIPEHVLADSKVKAEELMKNGKPKNWVAASLILLVWISAAFWLIATFYRLYGK